MMMAVSGVSSRIKALELRGEDGENLRSERTRCNTDASQLRPGSQYSLLVFTKTKQVYSRWRDGGLVVDTAGELTATGR